MERLEDFKIGKRYVYIPNFKNHKVIYTCLVFNSRGEPILEYNNNDGDLNSVTVRDDGLFNTSKFQEYKEPRKVDSKLEIKIASYMGNPPSFYLSTGHFDSGEWEVLARAKLSWDEENGFSVEEIK